MGWLWASPAPKTGPEPAARLATTPATTPAPPPPAAPTSKPAADDGMDVEFAKFLTELQAELKPSNKAQQQQSSTPSASEPSSSSSRPYSSSSPYNNNNNTGGPLSSKIKSYLPFLSARSSDSEPAAPLATSTSANPTPGSTALAESLHPADINCRQAFDLAYGCQSLGGQWNAIYRDGSLRQCSELWHDFWFCMRARGMSGAMREEAVREHYRTKELRKYAGKPNSEDVWRSRDEKVPPDSAFRVPYVPDDMTDEEWQLFEIERRRAIRKRMGLED